MARTNTTQYAILGLLSHQPQSGYDLKKTIDGSIGFFWNENYGHLYPILRRLEKAGLVARKIQKNRDAPFWRMTLNCGRQFAKAYRDWCDETLKALRIFAEKEEL